MAIIEGWQAFVQWVAEAGQSLFQQYNEIGRPVLDFLHIIFNDAYYLMLALLAVISAVYFFTTIYVMLSRKEPYHEKGLTEFPFVTVQIPTRNEIVALRCAEKCLEFDYPKDRYEVLIGDDSDKPEVSEKIRAFAEQHELVKAFKRENNSGYKAGNLNNMLPHSKGEYLVLFDSDFLPQRDFLKRIIAPMVHDKGIAGVQAKWKFINAGQNLVSVLGSSIGAVFHHVALPFFNKRKRLSVLCGSAEAVRKDVLIKLGGWEHGSLTEDIEYSLRLLENGYKIQYLPELECESEVPYTSMDLYKQQKRWAYGVVYSVREHFKSLFLGKRLNFEEKFLLSYIFSGYMLTLALALVLSFGVLSILTHKPEAVDFGRFFFETLRNVAATSGLLFASGYGLVRIRQLGKLPYLFVALFSVGIVVTYHVNVGIFRVFTGKQMPWFLLNKKGNETATTSN